MIRPYKGIFIALVLMILLIIPASAYVNPTYWYNLSPEYTGPVGSDLVWYGNPAAIGAIIMQIYTNSTVPSGVKIDGNYYADIVPFVYNSHTPITAPMVAGMTPGKYLIYFNGNPPYTIFASALQTETAPASFTFSISDSVNFTNKLNGVSITLSNGLTGTTNVSGMADFAVINSSAYTYSLVKTGYVPKSGQPVGGYGESGGVLYDTMDLATGYLPAGYIRTTVHTIDALTGSQISGTTINLRDVENNSWINSTADADGELIIDVLESHTLDVYGSYPGVFTESQELGAVPGGDYYLPMYATLPTPADGYVNVLTYVTSAVDDGPIPNAKVVYTYIDGSLKGQQVNTFTDSWGASLAVLKNATVVVIDVSKPNYNGQSASHTLPNFADVMYTFRLSKGGMITAVPTVTDPATGNVITAVPTYLAYCDPSRGDYDEALCGHSKDNALFGQLRDSGDAIIGLCILAIIFGLLKMIMKF